MTRTAIGILALLSAFCACKSNRPAPNVEQISRPEVASQDGDAAPAKLVDGVEPIKSPSALPRPSIMIPAGPHIRCMTCPKVQHRILELDAYRIDEVEVSNEEYEACVKAGVCRKLPAYADGIMPVVGVTWDDAKAFCHFVGGRLPTTAEWAKAAFPMDPGQNGQGPMISPRYDLCVVLNIAGMDGEPCEKGARYTEPYPISTKDPDRDSSVNEFDRASHSDGLVFDLFGNVAEWVEDWYTLNDYFYPPNPKNPRGPEQGTEKAICGGSFLAVEGIDEGECRPKDPKQGYPDVGFRCAYDVRPGIDANAAGAAGASAR